MFLLGFFSFQKRKNVYVDPLRKKTKSLQRTKKVVEVSVNENEKMPLEERTTEPKEKLEEIPNESESQTSDQTQPRKKRKTSSITTENKVIEQRQLRPSTIQYSEERRMLRELEREVLEERRVHKSCLLFFFISLSFFISFSFPLSFFLFPFLLLSLFE